MIAIEDLKDRDVGRFILYHPHYGKHERGVLSSWSNGFVFVRFRSLTGEACRPEDVSFESTPKKETEK